ncbi:probable ATP-dependent RNA helicase spindle-E [Nylanderia fulva]|uniref:probable ATP-dependent RNA helicase spindle-E n=1 Tax=Nylanderia fulva TaxID=613905 RepID=UPI0010FAD790|nr:probable ATP-dependent RNA helicase spindle-E [Nylanderia fulva]XP_029166029.1 probable ATP-dependent RNA helicase spindle-E [Nylanderia fulva]XP_029166030.1 probable ATP-dependent RNA helicase spindle-E [Nylanderia fulva]XP_029166031.1 probable ATP-dependent RNA helicase spindle-E [Nylanderia fulva]XP_029166032.1 probable ATP-dependent RNA helicase spindle-E [Nylanderia fulva]XP_029166033.1 probable ATP-dependent RNA helicase spindle-E [Nylanderia fulva]
MDSMIERRNSSIESEKLEEKTYVKDYTEAEVEQYLRLINSKDANSKKPELNTSLEGLNDNLQKLYVEDLAKDYQKCNFTYQPKSNDLSVISMKNGLISIIETNSVVVIQGPTGCGKTTQIPQFILDDSIKKKLNCNIIVTQPRRIAAINIAKRVSQESGWPLGSLIGYKVGMRKEHSPDTRLTYCTTEVLLNLLIHEKHMLKFTHIILDEIHERDRELDFLLLVIKKLLQTNSGQVKIILMSATIDVTRFAEYFSTRVGNKLMPAPIVKIPERRNFQICTYYLDDIENLGVIPEVSMEPIITQDMINFCSLIISALDQVDLNDNEKDSDSPQRHAVLIFLPGIYEIEELYNYLSSTCYVNKLWDIVTLHSLISSDEQQRVFYKSPDGYRRIILSTNIAESSITVPDVKYVIDFCLIKVLEVDSITNYQTLKLCWASKANCMQRAGRTGRVMDGRVFRLVPRAFYNNIFNNEGTPEMLRAPLANLVLRAKILDLDEPRALLSLSLNPPSLSNLAATVLTLKEVGALLDENDSFQLYDGKLTDLGRIMAVLPLDIRITKLIMLGHVFGVLRDAIILGSSMTIKDIFNVSQYRATISSYITRRKWAYNSDSDCIATLNIYKAWQNEKANRRLTTREAERQWAQRNEVNLKTLFELNALVNEITERLLHFGIAESIGVNKVIWEDTDRDFVLQVILAGAFYPNYFVKRIQNSKIYEENITMNLGVLDPMNTVYLRGWPLNQPGYLYAKQLQEIFAKHQGIPEKQIAVSFDDSKRVYVQFREKTSMNDNFYNISNFVYQAVKMRQCDVPFKINLLNLKEAQKMAKYHNVDKFEQTHFFNKDLKRIKSNSYKISPKLPGLDVTEIPLSIQTIISPGYFWAILDDNATRNKLKNIENILNKHPLKELSSPPKTSTIIAAPIERNNSLIYYRAIIEDFTSRIGDVVNIFFIDNGRSSRVRCSDLREINNITILEMPPLAFHCNLAFLQPSNQANFHGRWSKISRNYFIMQINRKNKIFGNIYSVVDNTVNLELIAINEKGEEFNINNDMIEKGYARRREESYLSTHNHELRMNINRMSMEEKKFYEEKQYDKDYLLNYPNPPKELYSSSINLQGPYSPLEMELIELTSAGKLKKATIDFNSVNCILLDDDHDQSLGRLLVAQIVSQGSNSGILILRNTTFLPNIPGLAALLTLSFTPYMELRCNSRRTYYTGALCGLGPMNNSTRRAMFPDHDMEIKFDVEITIDDVKEINKLRYWINAGMQLNHNSNSEHIINCQNRLQRILLELRDKQRKSRNPLNDEIDNYSDKWNYYEKSFFLPPVKETTRQYDIYPLHKALELREMDDKREEMLQHLVELQRFAYEDVFKMKNVVIFCKLCKMETTGLLELRSHLCSAQHIKNEKALRIS